MNNNFIELKNVTKVFGDGESSLRVLKRINLIIKEGSITSIIGESGAGKSTLLNILGTLLKPTEGEVFYNGEDISNYNDNKLSSFRNLNLGFIFQKHLLLPEFTAYENVIIPAMKANNGVNYKKRVEELMDYLGIYDRKDHYPNELSGGEQQRFSIARALINHPKLILADEPTGNLDHKNSDEIKKLLFKLNREFNQTVVFVTHDNSFAAAAYKKLEIEDGKII